MKAIMKSAVLILLLCLPSAESQELPTDWYQRYEYYPPYCSTPDDMSQRNVPPLRDDSRYGESRLRHVTAVIRHGARTPWGGGLPCWQGYQENPATAVWNCNLTTFNSPPPATRVREEEDEDDDNSDFHDDAEGLFLFEKRYTALYNPEYNLSNELNGTCQAGQLILPGYEQEVSNGRHLRTAYLFDSTQKGHDRRLKLIDSSVDEPWKDLYVRSDDEQRTVMSGQLILRGMLATELDRHVKKHQRYPIVPLYTADYSRDVVAPNPDVCPRLQEIKERVQQTWDYRVFNESREVATLRNFQTNVLGAEEDMGIDCLMTTICTDRPLPMAIDDYKGGDEDSEFGMEPPDSPTDYGTNLFLRLYNFYVRKYTFVATYNNNEYSKLAMGPLWSEIMDNVNAVVHEQDTILYPKPRPTPKVAVFAGHDTTIIPLLASLGDAYDEKWPPYASMVLLEIHELNIDGRKTKSRYPSDYGFRLLYNGRALTSLVQGCPPDADVCDISHLQRQVQPFATRNRACERQHPIPQTLAATGASRLNVAALLVLVLTSAAAGALGTLYVLRGRGAAARRPARRKYHAAAPEEDEDGIVLADYRDENRQDSAGSEEENVPVVLS